MKKVLCDKASRKHTYIMALSITMVMFLILVSIASVASSEDIKNSDSNNAFNFNKFDKAINAYEKATEIHLQNSPTLFNHIFVPLPIKQAIYPFISWLLMISTASLSHPVIMLGCRIPSHLHKEIQIREPKYNCGFGWRQYRC